MVDKMIWSIVTFWELFHKLTHYCDLQYEWQGRELSERESGAHVSGTAYEGQFQTVAVQENGIVPLYTYASPLRKNKAFPNASCDVVSSTQQLQ